MTLVVNTQAERDFLGTLVKAYQVAFGRQPDNAGLEYWFNQGKANGLDIVKTTAGFLPAEVQMESPGHFVDDLYHSVLGRDADLAGFNYWTNQLSSGQMTKQQVMLSFAMSQELGAKVIQSVFDVIQKATLGQPIDTSHGLDGIPAYDYTPKPPVTIIKEVPVEVPVIVDHIVNVPTPTAEAHTLALNADTKVSILAQKANGDFLSGTGIPALNFAVLHDNTDNVEIAAQIVHRQSAEDVNPIASGVNGNRAFVEYNIDAGSQNGLHGNPVNANRSEASLNFSISGAPGFMSDGDTQYQMKFYSGSTLVNTITLKADAAGHQAWFMPDGTTVAIGDDPTSTVAATNSVNMAFGFAYGQANLPAGDYKISIEQVGLTGLQTNKVTAALDVIFHAV